LVQLRLVGGLRQRRPGRRGGRALCASAAAAPAAGHEQADCAEDDDELAHASTLPQTARRSCSSSVTSSSPNVSSAGRTSQVLSPASSIVNWSRVIGGRGSRSTSAAAGRTTAVGTFARARLFPSVLVIRS